MRRRALDVDILDGALPDEVEPLLAMLRAAEGKARVADSREKTVRRGPSAATIASEKQ
jgi:hypothetical protein